MSDTTPRLALPLIGDHSQKRIVMNEGLMRLESLVQAQVRSRTTAAQPASPVDGDAYILPAGAAGAVWGALTAGDFVRSESATWETVAFPDGAIVHVADENRLVIRSGSGWAAFEDVLKVLDNLTHLGIGTTADATNVFAVKGPAALLSGQYAADGGSGDLSLSLNKEGDGDTAQILLQKNYSTRAVLGLLGNNNLTLKVSPDGVSFVTALSVNATTGKAAFAGQLDLADGSAGAPTLAFTHGGIYDDASNSAVAIAIAANQAVRVFATGVTYSAATGGGFTTTVQADGSCTTFVRRYSGDASGARFHLTKSRGSRASTTSVSQNDQLGLLLFSGNTGGATEALTTGIQITPSVIEATPSSSAFGSRLVFSLAPVGGSSLTETLRLEAGTGLSMYGANPVIDQNRNVRARIYTVATLPSAATAAGQRAQVSDASSPAFAAIVAGGGSTHSPVYSDGSTWRCG